VNIHAPEIRASTEKLTGTNAAEAMGKTTTE
jgi:hypothetical protein